MMTMMMKVMIMNARYLKRAASDCSQCNVSRSHGMICIEGEASYRRNDLDSMHGIISSRRVLLEMLQSNCFQFLILRHLRRARDFLPSDAFAECRHNQLEHFSHRDDRHPDPDAQLTTDV